MVMTLSCFTAYDIRGRLGVDLDEGIAFRIGRAFARVLGAGHVVLGHDCRASSAALADAVAAGLMAEGCDVLDLGLCGTEEVYFATAHLQADGGIAVTASHNPMDYNGMKMVRAGAAPVGRDSGLSAMQAMASADAFGPTGQGTRQALDCRADYVERVLSFVNLAALRPLHILVNAGNGTAGPTFDAIADGLAARGAALRFTRLHHVPDGTFPNGIPNPLLPENQPVTAGAVVAAGADMGVAWDGDFDRCFFFDHEGAFVPGEYVVGLLAEVFLAKEPGASIVHDPRVVLGTQDAIARAGGMAVQARTGHAFLKAALRETGAVYGGEMSAHHYFRDFMACDSGMIPWLLVAELMGRTGMRLAGLLAARRAAFPSSGEINFPVGDVESCIARVRAAYPGAVVDTMDGLSFSFPDWRFNLRASNTEPLLRLNVESRGDAGLVDDQVAAISAIIGQGQS
jgi:phosphomannomutase